MAITNTTKPSAPSLTNTTRASFAELWSTISTTWASETRTWTETGSLIDNLSKIIVVLADGFLIREMSHFILREEGGNLLRESGVLSSNAMTNINRPS